MTKLIYITHPEVEIDHEIPIDQWKISDKGMGSISRLLELNIGDKVTKVYTSQEYKAYVVAEKLAEKYNVEFEKIAELGEADRSSTGTISPPEEYMKVVMSAYDNLALGVRGWESHLEMMLRNAKIIETLRREHKGESIIIVGHGGAGTTVKCFVKRVLPSFAEDPQKTGCYFIADLDKWEILEDWKKY